MTAHKIFAELPAIQVIPNVDAALAEKLKLQPYQRSIALFTSTIDDIGYTAADEATKKADVDVVYAKSFYAGATHASGPLSGEFIAILAGPSPEEVKSALDAVQIKVKSDAYFEAINGDPGHSFYAHTISRSGTFLSKLAGVTEGEALAYLIAPPVEATIGLDAALKAADVQLCEWVAPPSETNFSGGLLTGSQSACQAAADAFRQTVLTMAAAPKSY
ncbi:ethanolamine utilization microcompartment protein EutL [Bacillus sp. V2I10]|uniref:ethanolamine utilization microcompartment protein EutL n=1 Tax=Bacillus sp. V2I10 TaxID=3042276 RepID=UPI00277F60ED|nr:ethanolamine utilization microcompartment protein EutL [Bacillus sp. V2I10]MDQ0862028.1 ethanolamine utilization protein EutL [Bacillus sp. V2I10]